MNLKEIMEARKAEIAKGDKADKSLIESYEAQMENAAAADYSQIKRLQERLQKRTADDESGKEAYEDQIAELKSELEKVSRESQRMKAKFETDLKAAQDIALTKSQTLTKLVKQDALQKELLSVGVKNPAHLKASVAMLNGQIQVDEEQGIAFVNAKDAKTGAETRKSVEDFVKEWAAGDEGKAFVSVAPSSGGGSNSNFTSKPGEAGTMSRADFQALSPAERMEKSKAGIKLTD